MVSASSIPLAPIIATAAGGEMRAIPLNQLHTSPTNPRKDITEASVEELAASIDAQGQLQPFLVREVRDEYFEVVAGNRRLRAQQLRRDRGKLMRDDLLMCVVRELTDQQVLEMQITENLQRADVHPMDEAEGYRKLLEMSADGDEGSKVEALARRLGKSKSFVWQRLKLADLAPKAADRFRRGGMTTSHAVDCARLMPADQDRYVQQLSSRGGAEQCSVKEMRGWIARDVRVDLGKAPFSLKDDALVKEAGACTVCPKCSGSQPELFEGLAGSQSEDKPRSDKPLLVCIDTGCYRRKVQTFVQRHAAELEERTSKKVVFLWGDEYYFRPSSGPESKLLTDREYRTAKKDGECSSTEPGIVAAGKGVGNKLWICRKNGCEVHHGFFGNARNVSASNDQARKQQAEAQRKVRLENEARATAFRLILHAAAQGKGCSLEDLRLIALAHLHEMQHDSVVRFGKAMGWKDALSLDGPMDGYREHAEKRIAQESRGGVLHLLLAMSLARDLGCNEYSTKDTPLLKEVGGRYNVDFAKIRADLQSADKAKRDAKAKKATAKKLKLARESKAKLKELAKESSAQAAPSSRGLSAAGRKRLAEMMKQRWAERKSKAKGAAA